VVDKVLIISQHGDYPTNQLDQMLYPRYEFFRKAAEVLRKGHPQAGARKDPFLPGTGFAFLYGKKCLTTRYTVNRAAKAKSDLQ
jgi:hypothetical protein